MTKKQKAFTEERQKEYTEYRRILKEIALDEDALDECRIAAIQAIFAFDDLHRERVNPFI